MYELSLKEYDHNHVTHAHGGVVTTIMLCHLSCTTARAIAFAWTTCPGRHMPNLHLCVVSSLRPLSLSKCFPSIFLYFDIFNLPSVGLIYNKFHTILDFFLCI